MKKLTALLLALVMVLSLCLSVSAASRFSDVSGHWAEEYIEKWVDRGVAGGYPDGTFRPDNKITRAEVAKVLAVAYELDANNGETVKFSDVSADSWYASYVDACSANGVLSGYSDGTFRPESFITRSEAVKMVAVSAGMGEVASGLEDKGFTDYDKMPAWAAGYWNALYHAGAIHGDSQGTLRPTENITRAELMKILCVVYLEAKVYELSVSISDNLGNTVSDKTSYLVGESKVVETLIPMLVANRENFAAVYPSGDMRDLLDEGIALAKAGYADGWSEEELAAWEAYITENFGKVQGEPSAIQYVSDVASPVGIMRVNVPYELKLMDTEEGREDICYTVTITLSIMN